MNLDILIITLFMIANLVIGLLASRNIKSLEHFSVGHRSFSTFAVFASLSASFIGGGYTLGNAAKVYQMGLVYAFGLLGFSVKEILVAVFIAPRMDKYRDCLSIGDMIEKHYGRIAKIITGVFAVVVCAGILGAQVGAMGAIVNRFFHLSAVWGILFGFGVIIFYSSLGGMRAVVYTDVIQFIILIVGIPLAFFVGLHQIGGWQTVLAKVPHTHIYFLQNHHDWVLFITLFFTFMFGETLVPPYVQRLFMAKSSAHTLRATLYSGLLSMPFFLLVGAIGLLALYDNPNLSPNAALPYIVQTQLSPLLRGFVTAGIIAIIMSSAAGFLNAGAVSFVNDIVKPLTSTTASDRFYLWCAKLSTFVIGLGAVIFALAINNVLDILLYAYNFWSPIILVPLVAAIFGFNVTKRDFLFGASAGVISMLVWTMLWHEPYHVSGVLVGVLANLIVFTLSYSIQIVTPAKAGVQRY